MSFESLPDDKLYELCEGLDIKTLGRFTTSYSRAYQLCSGILYQRKLDTIKGTWATKEGSASSSIIITAFPVNRLYIDQRITYGLRKIEPEVIGWDSKQYEYVSIIDPILLGMKSQPRSESDIHLGHSRYTKIIKSDDFEQVDMLYDNLTANYKKT